MKKKSYKKQAIILISVFLLVMVVTSLLIVNLTLGAQARNLQNPMILQNWVIFGLGLIALVVAFVFLRKLK